MAYGCVSNKDNGETRKWRGPSRAWVRISDEGIWNAPRKHDSTQCRHRLACLIDPRHDSRFKSK